MHTRLVLQSAIYVGTRDGEVYLLIASYSTFVEVGNRQLPAFRFTEALVHLEEVAGEETSLVATRSCAYLHLYVLSVLGVFRNKGYFYFFFQLGLQFFVDGKFLACHLFHLGIRLVGKDVLRLVDAVKTGYVAFSCRHDVRQVLVFFRKFHKPLLVGNDVGVGNKC